MNLIDVQLSYSFLRSQPWFSSLPARRQSEIQSSVSVTYGERGETILHANATVGGWYAVLDGLVKLESHSVHGRPSTFLGVPSGDWFGEGSALKDEPRRYDVIALRESRVLCLPMTEFSRLHRESISFNHFLVAHLNLRLGQAMSIIEAGRIRSPEQRVAIYLTRTFWPGQRRVHLSQEELGHLVGLARQTVNRVLKSLEAEGLVSLRFGRIDLVDEARLFERVHVPDRD